MVCKQEAWYAKMIKNESKISNSNTRRREDYGLRGEFGNQNQNNPTVDGLLGYCIKHGHWSVFEQAHMTLEIETTRDLLRYYDCVVLHFKFSQRYADTNLLAEKSLCLISDIKTLKIDKTV